MVRRGLIILIIKNITTRTDNFIHQGGVTLMENYNKHTSSGVSEDIIRSIKELVALEEHLVTLVLKYNSKITHNLTDDVSIELINVKETCVELKTITDLRRSQMLRLKEMYADTVDDNYWCNVKHLSAVAKLSVEQYQATGNTDDFHYMAHVHELLISTITKFLGVEVTSCQSCFSDILKAEELNMNG